MPKEMSAREAKRCKEEVESGGPGFGWSDIDLA